MPSKRPRILLVNRALIKKNGKVLLVQRSAQDRYMPGRWEFPGGKLDEGQDVAQAFAREIKEETGLAVKEINPVMFVQSYLVKEGPYKGMAYIGLYGTAKAASTKVVLSHEHDNFAWMSFGQINQLEITPEITKVLKSLKKVWE